jgi:hypothetical protein
MCWPGNIFIAGLFRMKIFKKVISFVIAFFLGGVFAVILGLTGVSFLAINALFESLHAQDSSAINPNLKAVLQLGAQYAHDLEKVDTLRKQIESPSPGVLCKILCNISSFEPDQFKDERAAYLLKYFSQSNAIAKTDPIFQLRVAEMSLLGQLFPNQIRSFFIEVQNRSNQPESILEKIKLTLELERALLRSAAELALKRNDIKTELARLKLLRSLKKECNRSVSPRKIQIKCEDFAAH